MISQTAKHILRVGFTGVCVILMGSTAGLADPATPPSRASLNIYGSAGLIDMPSGEHQPTGEVSTTVSGYQGSVRSTLTFQISSRFAGSFRYASLRGYDGPNTRTRFDRSFDVRFRVLNERKFLPAVTIGLIDFAGTGIYSGEYIVATKYLHPSLRVTAGIGWGRLGGRDGFKQRNINIGKGGVPDFGNWFRGPVAPFGGLEWQTPIEGLTFKAEYSSDAYVVESRRNTFTRKTPYNFGLEYQYNQALQLGVYFLNGAEFALKASVSFNPRRPPAPSGLEAAAQPVFNRPILKAGQKFSSDWVQQAGINASLRKQIQAALEVDQLELEGLKLAATEATVYLDNDTYTSQAEAVGRTARSLSRTLPASIEVFHIVLITEGVPTATISLRRSDLETLEYDPYVSEKLLERAVITNGPARRPEGLEYVDGLYPSFRWSLTPAVRSSFFDPDAPIRLELGLRARATYDIAPGLSISASVIKPLMGNLDSIGRGGGGNGKVPRVRSRAAQYFKQGDPALERLTADYVFKLRPDVYGRLSVGYLETMFGGISGEVLWKPAGRRFALGAELNYVKQRDFDQRFGFRKYAVMTGHVSAYWDLNNGFSAQVDAGRYLAGDLGATFTVNRKFDNGWRVGAFFTITNIPFKDFGEGSFDKGILLTIPMSWGVGKPTRRGINTAIRPLTRDGGARVQVLNRLYPMVSSADDAAIKTTWGRVWR